jgi:SAM-dependent methyltransferase
MSPEVYNAFSTICQSESPQGPILEVGAVPGPESLLNIASISRVREKTGLNIESFPSEANIKMVTGNANHMDMFADSSFGCVLCNSTLEHDARFWKTLTEMRRVTRPGGLIIIGVPGFRGMGPPFLAPPESFVGRTIRLLAKITRADALLASTSTLGEHFFPGDYYRFTEQAVMDVFLEGLVQKRCQWVMTPPRIIGWARKPFDGESG